MSADVSEEMATLAENASIAATNAARRAREAAGTARELATELRARREAEAHEASPRGDVVRPLRVTRSTAAIRKRESAAPTSPDRRITPPGTGLRTGQAVGSRGCSLPRP
jgi:hypothetical protein